MTMGGDPDQDPRNVEAVVLARLIEGHPDGLTKAQVLASMTEMVLTPERVAAVENAIEGLVEVGLLVRAGAVLRPTQAALRAGELELGL
jgi:hypothetical protein